MIVQKATLVVPVEDGQSALMLLDLRKFMAEAEDASGDVTVSIERRLYDGFLADVIEAEWTDR